MEKKKVFKIRRKGTDKFLSVGYAGKNSWSVYPSAVINANPHIFRPKEDFEIVVFEYQLIESKTIELK